jgi:hypothetical protein
MNEVETISHLVIQCSAALERCRLVDWFSPSVEECIRQWFQKKELTEDRAIPCLILWGIWLAHDVHLLKINKCPLFKLLLRYVPYFRAVERAQRREFQGRLENCRLTDPFPVGSLMGACQGQESFSSSCGLLFISDSNRVKFKAG